MKKVLIIAYDFPPNGITSSRRPGAMAKYLEDFGWKSFVVCQQWTKDNCNFDENFVPNMPQDLRIYKVDTSAYQTDWAKKLKASLARIFLPQHSPYSFVVEAKKTALRAAIENDVDMIWATAPHGGVLEVAAYVSKKINKPWVADFRDVHQWMPNLLAKIVLPIRLAHEKSLLQSAAAITAVSKGFANVLATRHRRMVSVVSHGYDKELTEGAYPTTFAKFNIVYTGGLVLGNPDLKPLLSAIGNLIDAGRINKADVSLEFYGKGNEEKIEELCAGHKHRDIVVNFGPIPREKLIHIQRQAAILLLASHPGTTGWITSKVFEYLIAYRPILSIPKDNDCIDEMIQSMHLGDVCDSVTEMEAVLEKLYNEWRSTGAIKYPGDRAAVEQYSYEYQVKKMSLIFKEVLVHHEI